MSDWEEVGVLGRAHGEPCTLCKRVRGIVLEDVSGDRKVVFKCCTDCLDWMHERGYDVLKMLTYAHNTMPVDDITRDRRQRVR